jgi:hypothetical protein
MLRLHKQVYSAASIVRLLSTNNVGKYLRGKKKCFLTHLRAEHERLGAPRMGFKWLPIRLKPRGTPDKDWIEVPIQVRDFSDIISALDQLRPTEDSFKTIDQFGYKCQEEVIEDRSNHLGFLIGVILGDAGKDLQSVSRFPSMKLSVVLSKAKQNSERFGKFTSLCVNNALGLRMHRAKDAPASEKRFSKSECFQWIAPVSPLFAWVFRVMMGLTQGERTTYDPLRPDWLLNAPLAFRLHFLQGLAESDGWVNPGRDRVIIVASPNEQLLDKLLTSLEVPHRFDRQKVNIVVFETAEGLKLPIFNERLLSNNYDNLVTMATASRFLERSALPDWFLSQIRGILSNCHNYNQACLEIAKKTSYKVSNQTVAKYAHVRS